MKYKNGFLKIKKKKSLQPVLKASIEKIKKPPPVIAYPNPTKVSKHFLARGRRQLAKTV